MLPRVISHNRREAFATADREGWFIEAVLIEPVMGEGNPGRAITREFYDVAHELSTAHGATHRFPSHGDSCLSGQETL